MTPDSDLLFYEGCMALTSADGIDVGHHVDLLVASCDRQSRVDQKLHRDRHHRGYSQEAVVDTICGACPTT